MTKLLLYATIAFSIGAAALGYMNRDTLIATQGELSTTQSTLATTKQNLDSANKEIEDQKGQITTLNSEKDTLTSNLNESKNQLDATKTELSAAQEKITAVESEIETLKTDMESKDTRIAELEQQTQGGGSGAVAGGGENLEALTAERDELKTVKAGLEDKITKLESQLTEFRGREEARQKSQIRQGLQGTILAVNQAWNFVVLSLGDRQGVVPNAEMLVQRGNQLVGRVRITSVEPATSIADILVRTVPRGMNIMPGDTVIYQAQRD